MLPAANAATVRTTRAAPAEIRHVRCFMLTTTPHLVRAVRRPARWPRTERSVGLRRLVGGDDCRRRRAGRRAVGGSWRGVRRPPAATAAARAPPRIRDAERPGRGGGCRPGGLAEGVAGVRPAAAGL